MQNDREKFKKDFIRRLINLSIAVIKFSSDLKSNPYIRIVLEQLVRSVTSIGANVVEAKSSSSRRDYIKYFEIALKSANESKYWLILLKEFCDNKVKVEEFLQEVNKISKIIASSLLTLKGKR